MSFRLSSPIFITAVTSILVVVGVGCQSASGPASASFASVVIKGHSVQEIANTATQVFREAGYAGGPVGSTELVFQREGSKMTNLAYEGIADTFYGAQTLIRVKAEIVNLGGDSNRLQCQAYIVKGAGDAFFQEEQRLTNLRSGPYRSLLKKVAEQLK